MQLFKKLPTFDFMAKRKLAALDHDNGWIGKRRSLFERALHRDNFPVDRRVCTGSCIGSNLLIHNDFSENYHGNTAIRPTSLHNPRPTSKPSSQEALASRPGLMTTNSATRSSRESAHALLQDEWHTRGATKLSSIRCKRERI